MKHEQQLLVAALEVVKKKKKKVVTDGDDCGGNDDDNRSSGCVRGVGNSGALNMMLSGCPHTFHVYLCCVGVAELPMCTNSVS